MAHSYPGDFTAVYVPSPTKKDPVSGEPYLYTVIINEDGSPTTCDCSGFTYRGYCKHKDLIENYIKEKIKNG